MRDSLEYAYACLPPRPAQWKRPQGGYIPFGEAVVAATKKDTNADTKVGALDKSSAREAVTTNADHVRLGDWHTMKRTSQIVAAANAASASGPIQPTQRESVISSPVGIYNVSLNVESADDKDSDAGFIGVPSSPPSDITPNRVVSIEDDPENRPRDRPVVN